AGPEDLRQLVIEFAAQLLVQTNTAKDLASAREQAVECLRSGAPRKKWNEMLCAQGADLDSFNQKLDQSASSGAAIFELKATQSGVVTGCDARTIGEVVRDLGGGRLNKESMIDFEVGVDQIAKPNDLVN